MSQPWQPQQQPNPPFGPQGYPGQPGQGYPPQPQGYPPQPQGYPPQPYPGHLPPGYTPQGYAQPTPGQAPLGQQPLPTNDIAAYAAPKQRGPVLLVVVAVLVLVGVIVAAAWSQQRATLNPGPNPTPTEAATPTWGMPFTMPSNSRATGHWEIVSREWSGSGVTLNVRVACDTDTCSYGFVAFPNTGSTYVEPGTTSRQPALTTGTLRAGQMASGYVFIPLERAKATLILTTSAGRQISALPIDA